MCKRIFFILGLIILISAFQPIGNKELTDIQRQEIADTIRKRTKEWHNTLKDINHKNLGIFLDFFVESNEASWMNNPAIWVGNLDIQSTKEKTEELWRPIVDERSSHDIKLVEDHIAILSADHAIHVFKANYWITDTEGNTSKEHTCVITNVYVRKDDVWKILHHHQSYD